jgi:hypothetical protein
VNDKMASRFRSIALCAGVARPSARPVRWYASSALLPLLPLFLSEPQPALAASEDWQFEAGIATDKVTRDMDISYDQPSLSLTRSWYPGNGFFAGASAASIR